jgi:hypothetical protein
MSIDKLGVRDWTTQWGRVLALVVKEDRGRRGFVD